MSVSVPLEFKVVEREVPDLDSTSKSGIRRGKIKEHDIPKWVSLWIPWENYMDVTGFVRNLKRELAAVGLAARGDVDRDLRARIAEANILAPPKQTQTILDDESSHSKSLHHTPGQHHTPPSYYPSSKKRSRRSFGGNEDEEDDNDETFTLNKNVIRSSTYRTRSVGVLEPNEMLDLDSMPEKKPPRSVTKPMKNCLA